jgi:hypothetical protein
MKKLSIGVLLFLSVQTLFGQNLQISEDSIPFYFNEIKKSTQENYELWNKDLYGAMLLVNPQTREIYANEPDEAGLLKKEGAIYRGLLPNEINFANTAIDWNGKRWAMIMLPLPRDKQSRINLLSHELFHKAQPSLGFVINNMDNNHLDQKDGRIYLRLELEALEKALLSESVSEVKEHLTNALIFRKYRNILFVGSDTTENVLELNEGIAEYTGQMISGRNKEQTIENFEKSLSMFIGYPTYVRSFAYQTIPIYSFLLLDSKKGWNKEITVQTNLIDYFIKAFNIQLPNDLHKSVIEMADKYNNKTIVAEETARDEKNKQRIAEYKVKFIEQPHLDIQLEQMQFAFDPRNIMPLEDKGTVYPNIRITDKWGILTVESGALVSPNWKKVSLSKPTDISDKKVIGDGWILELEEGYKLTEMEEGNYKLIRNTALSESNNCL